MIELTARLVPAAFTLAGLGLQEFLADFCRAIASPSTCASAHAASLGAGAPSSPGVPNVFLQNLII